MTDSKSSENNIDTDVIVVGSKGKLDTENSLSKTAPDKESSPLDEEIIVNDLEPTLSATGAHNAKIFGNYYRHPISRGAIFFSLFLIYYAYGLDDTIRGTYQTLATSSYNRHSLLSTILTIKRMTSAASQIWFGRTSDIFSRELSLIFAILFYVVGTVIESQATSIPKYAAGACLYGIGHGGVLLLCEIYMADFSNLNWRIVAENAPMLPYIINTWISGDITSAVGSRWKWGIGMWAFIFPLSCIPLLAMLTHIRYLAVKNKEGIIPTFRKPKSTSWITYLIQVFFWRVDFVGLVLLVAHTLLILIPFTLSGGIHRKWNTPYFIIPEVIGWVVALPLFIVWELKLAQYPIARWDLMKDRGIYSPMIIAFFIQFSLYLTLTYLYTFLLVAVDQTVKSATRINSLMSFVNVLVALGLGLVVVKIRRTKFSIIVGCIGWFIAFGLFIRYNGGLSSRAGTIGGVCLLGFGYGFVKAPAKASLHAAAFSQDKIAIVTALYLCIGNIGTSLGAAVSGATWSNILPEQIESRIKNQTLADMAYSSPIGFIKTHKWGKPERIALLAAYKYVWKILNIIGLIVAIPMLLASFLLRDKKLVNSVALDQQEESTDNSDYDEMIKDNSKNNRIKEFLGLDFV